MVEVSVFKVCEIEGVEGRVVATPRKVSVVSSRDTFKSVGRA